MKVTAPHDCYLAAVGHPVGKGEQVDVDDATGASLIEQGWKPAKAAKAEPAPAAPAKDKPAKPAKED